MGRGGMETVEAAARLTVLGLSVALIAGCSSRDAGAQPPSSAEIDDAWNWAQGVIGFDRDISRAELSRLDNLRPGVVLRSARIMCARSRATGQRVLVIGEGQVADASANAERFQVLWRATGCDQR